MIDASKIKNGLMTWLCAMIVMLCLGETCVGKNLAATSLELGQTASTTQTSTSDFYDASQYDASSYAVAPKSGTVTVYRGVWDDHPSIGDALKGKATPWGMNDASPIMSPVRHNAGETRSIFTSWTRNPALAAERADVGGVVLRFEVPKSRLIRSPDIFDEAEVLIPGRVTGATPTRQ